MNPQPWVPTRARSGLVWAQHPEGQRDFPLLQQSALGPKSLVWPMLSIYCVWVLN